MAHGDDGLFELRGAVAQVWKFAPFRLRGELDLANAGEFREQLSAYAATDEGEVVCDCLDLEFLDSSGIAMLLEVRRELAAQGRGMRLVNVIGIVRRCLDVCGLTEHFGITDEAPVVLTPAAITMLRHLVNVIVIGDRARRVGGLTRAVARDALDELEAAGYAQVVKVPKGRDCLFVVTAAGRRKAARLEASASSEP